MLLCYKNILELFSGRLMIFYVEGHSNVLPHAITIYRTIFCEAVLAKVYIVFFIFRGPREKGDQLKTVQLSSI